MTNRYNTENLTEAQFQSGSNRRVLKNLLGIKSKREMDALGAVKLSVATDWAIRNYSIIAFPRKTLMYYTSNGWTQFTRGQVNTGRQVFQAYGSVSV